MIQLTSPVNHDYVTERIGVGTFHSKNDFLLVNCLTNRSHCKNMIWPILYFSTHVSVTLFPLRRILDSSIYVLILGQI